MRVKLNTLKQQRTNAELETIIESFGNAMRNANREYMNRPLPCSHVAWQNFTPSMVHRWYDYLEFCRRNPSEKA